MINESFDSRRVLLLGQLLDNRGVVVMRHAQDREGNDRELPFDGKSIWLHPERRQDLLSLAEPATLVDTDGTYARTWMTNNPPLRRCCRASSYSV